MKDDRVYLEQIAGMRDKVIHEHFGVNLEIVWRVVDNELPRLKTAVDDLSTGRSA